MKRILVTGATGQIGTELTRELRRVYGAEAVIAAARRRPRNEGEHPWEPFVELDVTDGESVRQVLEKRDVDTVFHLAAVLSVKGEREPQQAWRVNVDGLHHVLEAARLCGVTQLFWPSSIAAFGPGTPLAYTPQDTVMRPSTIYGITKVTGELLCDYYFQHHGLDTRGVRYPGVISSGAPPGGGTTDFAVEIFHAALRDGRYTCFVREETVLPMIYMPDCIRAAISLMQADTGRLRHRNSFNISAMSFSAGQLAAEIRKHIPQFECRFEPDERQAIADSWPRELDDSAARSEWDWQPEYGLAEMTVDMLDKLTAESPTAT